MTGLNEEEFTRAYRAYMDENGHEYDPWDLVASWSLYKVYPEDYAFLYEGGYVWPSK